MKGGEVSEREKVPGVTHSCNPSCKTDVFARTNNERSTELPYLWRIAFKFQIKKMHKLHVARHTYSLPDADTGRGWFYSSSTSSGANYPFIHYLFIAFSSSSRQLSAEPYSTQ